MIVSNDTLNPEHIRLLFDLYTGKNPAPQNVGGCSVFNRLERLGFIVLGNDSRGGFHRYRSARLTETGIQKVMTLNRRAL